MGEDGGQLDGGGEEGWSVDSQERGWVIMKSWMERR